MTDNAKGRKESFRIPEEAQEGMRLDKFLALRFPEFSRSLFKRLIVGGRILCDGTPCRHSDGIRHGSLIEFEITPSELGELVPQELPLDVLYEDEHLLVIDKRAGIIVHPANGNPVNTIVNAVLFRYGNDEFEKMTDSDMRPGIVHRLDKDTSGALIVAKTAEAQSRLKTMFQNHEIKKIYLAIILGTMEERRGAIDLPIGRHPSNPLKRAIVEGGREALTEYRTVAATHDAAASLVKVRLHTGRTHQIRVHFSHLGHPVLGDTLYGGCPADMPCPAERQMLHAWRIAFSHPFTGKALKIQAPPPDDFIDALKALGLPQPPDSFPKGDEK